MTKRPAQRVAHDTGIAGLVDALSGISPTDLQSLLIEVYGRVAGKCSPARLLEQYRTNRFVAPSTADPRRLAEVERVAWSMLPDGYTVLELSPLSPLGTSSVIATVSQNNVVSTIRNTEVMSDPTNVLALEAAVRRKGLKGDRRGETVLLAASNRVVRAQAFSNPRYRAHFRLLGLGAAGRDEGSFGFESRELVSQLRFYLRFVGPDARVAITDITDGTLTSTIEQSVIAPLAAEFPKADLHMDPKRTAGRGYYVDFCFKIFADDVEAGDGGMTDWTQRLLSNSKERLLISGIALERLLE